MSIPKTLVSIPIFLVWVLVVCLAILLPRDSAVGQFNENEIEKGKKGSFLMAEKISTGVHQEVGVARAIEGFCVGSATVAPDHNSTNTTDRIQEFDKFGDFASQLHHPWVLSMQLQPSGIIYQGYPAGSAPQGLDLLNREPSGGEIERLIVSKEVQTVGPVKLFQGGVAIITRIPIFVNLTHQVRETWWGNVGVLVEISQFLDGINITSLVDTPFMVSADYADTPIVYNTSDYQAADKTHAINTDVLLPGDLLWRVSLIPKRDEVTSADIGIAFLAAILSGLFVVLCIHLWVYSIENGKGRRDNSAAPQDAHQPFAMVFTDIQSSTSLWAHDPEAMSFGVELHHQEIRQLIKKHSGYEVKTIGDSFMVAFKNPKNAVLFALEIQTKFLALDWESSSFDEIYAVNLEDAIAEGTIDQKMLESCTNPDFWRGIRVRVGIHFGEGTIQFDEVTQGYDYYGTIVNTAARVEGVGHGGQILVTDSVYSSVFGSEASDSSKLSLHNADGADAPPVCLDLGPQPLRGLNEPIQLFQLSPKSLVGRKFPPLRLSNDAAEEILTSVSESHRSRVSTGTIGSRASIYHQEGGEEVLLAKLVRRHWKETLAMDGASARLREGLSFVNGLLATCSPKYRHEFISTVAGKWNVELPKARQTDSSASKKKNTVAVEGMALLQILVKVLKSIEVKENRAGGGASNGIMGLDSVSGRGSQSLSRRASESGNGSAPTPVLIAEEQPPGMVNDE